LKESLSLKAFGLKIPGQVTVDQLAFIKQPTLIMAGKNDPICSLTATEIMGKGIAGSETILFDNASHFFLMEQPEKFNRSLKEWLDTH
jgi:pimeloyl-ACP methyl ester carboxylesterase